MIHYKGAVYPVIKDLFNYLFSHFIIADNITLHFFGPFNTIEDVKKSNPKEINIFFCGENTHVPHYSKFKDEVILSEYVDVIAGFFENSKKSVRFPLWLFYYYYWNKGLFKSKINNNRKESALLVAQNLTNRVELCNKIKKANIQVLSTLPQCGTHFQMPDRNAHQIHTKVEVCSVFKYNICSENSDTDGYVTEKLFHAFEAGCIPLYWPVREIETNIIKNEYILYIDDKLEENKNKYKMYTDDNFWTEDAYFHICWYYLKFWNRVYKRSIELNFILDRKKDIEIISYNIDSDDPDNEIKNILKSHYKKYNKLFEPRPVFYLNNKELHLEDLNFN